MSTRSRAADLQQQAVQLFRQGAFGEAAAALEQAFSIFSDEGDLPAALRLAIRLASLNDTLGQPTASRAWQRRAERLLERCGSCVEQGYLALCLPGCVIHDPLELAERADLALSVARQFGDYDLELRAMADRGLAHVRLGEVETGFALLDDVMLAVAAGGIKSAEMRALTVCAMMSACERTGDASRAAYWRERVVGDSYLNEVPVAGTHCIIAQGAVNALLGEWEAAEDLLQAALQASMSTAYHRINTLAYLADLRTLQGRLSEAAELLAGQEDQFEALPALARLRLAQGKPEEAAAQLRLVVRGLGSDRSRLAPVLSTLLEAELRSGQSAAAESTARRLAELADAVDSSEIRAMGRLAAGRVALAKGEYGASIEELESGLALLQRAGRPVLAGELRLELARARKEGGARAAAEAALATFSRLGAAAFVQQCRSLLEQLRNGYRVESRNPAGLSDRELEVARLLASGKTNQEIADVLVLSVRTVERHVSTIYEKLGSSGKTARAAATAYVLSHDLT